MIRKLTFFIAAGAALSSAAVISSYNATSGAPGTQGWTPNGGVLSGALINDGGVSAWQMTGDNCCGYWYDTLTSQQWSSAFSNGWSLRGIARSPTASSSTGYIFLDVPGTLANRFDISFGFDGTNGWVGLSMWSDSSNPALKHTFSGNAYHLFDMRYDPATQRAGLWVDGIQVLSGYTGHTLFRESHGPAFGVTGNTVPANFSCVQFTVNDGTSSDGCGVTTAGGGGGAVPEPSTFVLTAAALIALRLGRNAARC